ncbi:hypothetical protein Q4603_09520 [Zobellia galactanivorans]|uniref:Conserved hypothetical periplasmic protein n=1 Tax=Zobellia galactanivorans (strain DSM 12802 / CCUG 47099 / CIP 106680 / NCIMB 13871 / Dsij) TaxID=63186 RepID=G0L3K2_ZOBGA|nr:MULTISPECIES: hypothetical protein [Zobellia]MDO6808850.1 hypothetical protein [Zobellia galactanivorans]OWW25815.1 hypothetical protein B4Q04_09485 [Zobellia sp. OII3]CAZ98475.1 Conserved hypothetical periplasmic protein [Zobellia galactanivorans]
MFLFSLLLGLGLASEMPPTAEKVSSYGFTVETVLSTANTKNFRKLDKTASDSIVASYTHTKISAGQLRLRLKEGLRQGTVSLETIKTAFTDQLVDKIIPHWYGTPWSFGGHTTIPKEGKIACGYFISTTLRDMGLNLDRYKLAQKSPIDEAKMISCGSAINKVVQNTPEKAHEEIDRLTQEGLYFIGFDEGHVGYLLKREGELFLIHSNYLAPVSVCMETLQESRVFKKFDTFYLVPISHNESLLQRWLDQETVL